MSTTEISEVIKTVRTHQLVKANNARTAQQALEALEGIIGVLEVMAEGNRNAYALDLEKDATARLLEIINQELTKNHELN